MKNGNFLLGLAVGVGLVYLWKLTQKVKGDNPNAMGVMEVGEVTKDVVTSEAGKFGQALKAEYDIVMPSDQISKKVRQKAKELTRGRYAIKENNINPPVSL